MAKKRLNATGQQSRLPNAARDVSFKSTAKTVDFSLDIAAAYPAVAAVKSWQRSLRLNRGKDFIISDQYTLTENKGSTALHFMTACKATITKPGVIRLEGDGFVLEMTYDASKLNAKTEIIPIDDGYLQSAWGNSLTRIKFEIGDRKLTGSSNIRILY